MTVILNKPELLDTIGNTHCVIEASAGTGKTYIIENMVLDLIMQGIALDKILLVTFTTKAALELKIRIRKKLESVLHTLTSVNKLEKLNNNTTAATWIINERHYFLLQIALSDISKLNVYTIHSFCQQILSQTMFENGGLLRQTLTVNNNLFLETFKNLIRTRFTKNSYEKQILVEALTILGGIEKLSELLEDALAEFSVLDLPTNNSIKNTIKHFPIKITKILIEEFDNYQINNTSNILLNAIKLAALDIRNYKAIINRLKQILNGIQYTNNSKNYGLFWRHLTATDLQYLCDKLSKCINAFHDTKKIAPIIKLFNSCELLLNKAYDFKSIIVATFLPIIKNELDSAKQKIGIFDFNDMIILVYQALKSNNKKQILQYLQKRFQIAIIDEFQDTDKLQWSIFSNIFLDDKHRLILVGDPKQAIYGFRNGDLPTYLAATKKVMSKAKRSKETLSINFRSTCNLINIQNQIFNQNKQPSFFTGKNSNLFEAVSCGQPNLKLSDKIDQPLPALILLDINTSNKAHIKQELAILMAKIIKETLHTAQLDGERIKPEQIMVLTYSTKECREIEFALKAINVPCMLFKQDGLLTTIEATFIKDLFIAIDDPMDDDIRAKVLLGPFFNLSFNEIVKCKQNPEDFYAVKLLFSWQQLIYSRRYGEFFSKLMSESYITQNISLYSNNDVNIANIRQILEIIHIEALKQFCTPTDLAYKLQCWTEGINWPDLKDIDTKKIEVLSGAVQILTIHKSKGLEAPIVAIYGGFSSGNTRSNIHRYYSQNDRKIWIGSQKNAPLSIQELINIEQEEEYQRLFYVALTRAKAQLILPRITNKPVNKNSYDTHKWPYDCVNKQLFALPIEMFEKKYIVCRDANSNLDTLKFVEEQESHNVQNLELLSTENLFPDFHKLAKKSRPMCRFSYTTLHNYFSNTIDKIDTQKTKLQIKNYSYISNDNVKTDINISNSRLGIIVHKILQLIPLETTLNKSKKEWLEIPSVMKLFDDYVPIELHDLVSKLVYQAITNPLISMENVTIELCKLKNIIRELEFTMPYPGCEDMINGSIDMIFQFNNKIYILDWKTNMLSNYSQNTLEKIVLEHYLLQVKIYIIAVCRFFKIMSKEIFDNYFGEFIYVFLRGLPHQGTYHIKPSWSNILDWEKEIEMLSIY